MLHKFYVVAENATSKDSLKQDLVAQVGDEAIPERTVDVIDAMPHSEHNTAVMLTQEEADALMSDLRIVDVHRDPYELGVQKTPFGIRPGNYSKSATAVNTSKNWGLLRAISTTHNFGLNTTITANVPFNLDGTGVDIVVIDTGVEPNHPEFAVNADGTGGSRVVDYDWSQHGIMSVPTGGFLGDCDGHGSNCASIAAGNTCGWAKGSAIYTLRGVGDGTAGPYTDITDGRTLGLLDDFQIWQTIRAFHNSKPVNPATGYKRPTIVNCSFGFNITYRNVTDINYRGSATGATTTTVAFGTIGVPEGGSGVHGYRYSAIDAEVAATIAAGIIIVGAAGNDRHKIDVSGGADYNNYWSSSFYGSSFYYHRGSTPAATNDVITVGCIAAFANSDPNPEHKRNFSCAGPRVDVWAPGDYIMGAYANAPYSSAAVVDPRSPGPGSGTYTVTNSGASAYIINSSSNPTLTLKRGGTYTFNVSASGHPFWIKTAQVTGTGSAYNTGVTNNGTQSGTITFTVPEDAPSTLYYICQFHGSMVGTINVVEGTYNYYLNAISGTSQASPQVVGLLACILQARPWMNQRDCRNFLEAYSSNWAVNEAYYGGADYGNFGSLQGGPARALYQPFNLPDPLTIRG